MVPDTILIKPFISTSSALPHVLVLYERHSPKNEFLIHFILSVYKGVCGVVNQLDLMEVECIVVNFTLTVLEAPLLVLQQPYPIEKLQHVGNLHFHFPQPLCRDNFDHSVDTPEELITRFQMAVQMHEMFIPLARRTLELGVSLQNARFYSIVPLVVRKAFLVIEDPPLHVVDKSVKEANVVIKCIIYNLLFLIIRDLAHLN